MLQIKNNKVKKFQEKVDNKDTWINGGFFVFNSQIFKYLKKTSDSLEQNILTKIVKDKIWVHTNTTIFGYQWIRLETKTNLINYGIIIKRHGS